MLDPWLEKEILHHLAKLSLEQQQQVLHFARALAMSKPLGVPGKELRRFAGTIALDDLQIAAIAKQHQVTLVTRDGHFNDIEGLLIEVW